MHSNNRSRKSIKDLLCEIVTFSWVVLERFENVAVIRAHNLQASTSASRSVAEAIWEDVSTYLRSHPSFLTSYCVYIIHAITYISASVDNSGGDLLAFSFTRES